MSVNESNGLSHAALSQSIIIALVAGAVLTAGMMSVMYRRRRRNQFLARLPGYRLGPGGRLIRIVDMDERGVGGTSRAGEEKRKSGKKPGFWDVWVGESGGEKEEEEEKGDVDVGLNGEGRMKGGWRPLGLSYSDVASTGAPTTYAMTTKEKDPQIEMTILIAMPSPTPRTTHNRQSSTFTSTSSSSSLHKPHLIDDYPILYENPPDQEEIPVLELATTSIPLIISKEEEKVWAGLTESARWHRRPEDTTIEANSRIRIVRTDGFGPR